MTVVVAVVPNYPPDSLVGSWISTHEVLKHLAGLGFAVRVATIDQRTTPHVYEGIPVARAEHHQMGAVVAGADLVISHLGDNGEAHLEAFKRGIPSMRMVHSIPRDLDRQFPHSTLLVFNSEGCRRQLVEWEGRPSLVVYPPVDPDRYRTTPGDRVTLINATAEKGMGTVAQVAERMPAVRFLAVESDRGTNLDFATGNGERIATTTDMRAVYARTRILLMPSASETWGRTAVEAAVSGIPTVAHPCAGLVEAMGDAVRWVDRDDIEGWVAAVADLRNPAAWQAASGRAQARWQELETVRIPQLDLLADACASLTGGRSTRMMGP